MDRFNASALDAALQELGTLLLARGQHSEIVVIGGGALLLTGLGARVTEDCDVVAVIDGSVLRSGEPLPQHLADASRAVAIARGLDEGWLNAGPASLMRFGLPDGFMERAATRAYGSLRVHFASRLDQIHFKLFAVSRADDKHAIDLRALAPTRAELELAAAWGHARSAGGFSAELAHWAELFAAEADRRG